jgi:spore coat polysaccharide biosynthesis protein SpsF
MLCLVQARSSSKRFPKKIFFKIKKKTLIEKVVDRIKLSKKVSKIVVVTSKNKTDDKLAKLLFKKKIDFYRGSLNNVAKRCCQAAQFYNEDFFIRISADSPFIDGRLIDKIIAKSKKKMHKVDLVTNAFPRTFPQGQSIEIINTKKLQLFLKKMSRSEREHVTEYFYKNNKKLKILNIKSKINFSKIRLTIDYRKDLDFIEMINKKFNNNVSYQKISNFILKSKS